MPFKQASRLGNISRLAQSKPFANGLANLAAALQVGFHPFASNSESVPPWPPTTNSRPRRISKLLGARIIQLPTAYCPLPAPNEASSHSSATPSLADRFRCSNSTLPHSPARGPVFGRHVSHRAFW